MKFKQFVMKLEAKLSEKPITHNDLIQLKQKILILYQWFNKFWIVIAYPIFTFWLLLLLDLKNYSEIFFCVFIFITFIIISLLLLIPIFKYENQKIKIVFLILLFISLNFIFASIYYYEYLKYPTSYSVSNTIKNDKFLNDYNKAFNKLQETNKLILLISEMEYKIDTTLFAILSYKENAKLKGCNHKLNFGYYYHFECHPYNHGTDYVLCFENSTKKQLKLGEASFCTQIEAVNHPLITNLIFHIKDRENLFYYLEDIIHKLKILREKTTNDLNRIVSLNANLKFIDFYYFSTITTTTTGYGDIIPNKSSVRTIVIIQTLFSVLFIAFGLSLFSRKHKS